MAGYTYDSTGQVSYFCSSPFEPSADKSLPQSYFFALTILLCFLLPFTYSTLRGGSERSAARVPYPCVGWNQKSDEVKKSKAGGAKGLLSLRCVGLPDRFRGAG